MIVSFQLPLAKQGEPTPERWKILLFISAFSVAPCCPLLLSWSMCTHAMGCNNTYQLGSSATHRDMGYWVAGCPSKGPASSMRRGRPATLAFRWTREGVFMLVSG